MKLDERGFTMKTVLLVPLLLMLATSCAKSSKKCSIEWHQGSCPFVKRFPSLATNTNLIWSVKPAGKVTWFSLGPTDYELLCFVPRVSESFPTNGSVLTASDVRINCVFPPEFQTLSDVDFTENPQMKAIVFSNSVSVSGTVFYSRTNDILVIKALIY